MEGVVDAALKAAVRDTEDRGDDDKPRKVIIEVIFKKIKESNLVAVNVKAKTVLPQYETPKTIGEFKMDERGQPEIAFAPNAPGNPDQQDLPLGDAK